MGKRVRSGLSAFRAAAAVGLGGAVLMGTTTPASALENGVARTPPMGWNSWNKFHCNVSEDLIKGAADAMVSSGMKDAGYQYVVIDDCWQVSRDDKGNIVADPQRFPNGMKAVADYVHSKGLKFGLYSDAGNLTCQRRPGGRDHEVQDANQYAAWGVDYLKYDWCASAGLDAKTQYRTMSDALLKAGRKIVFSICEWGVSEPWTWAGDVGNLWRTTGDIVDAFDRQPGQGRGGGRGPGAGGPGGAPGGPAGAAPGAGRGGLGAAPGGGAPSAAGAGPGPGAGPAPPGGGRGGFGGAPGGAPRAAAAGGPPQANAPPMGVLQIIDRQADIAKYAGPGHWNDPDMLEVGNGGMTNDEYRAHFSMWAIMAAPLMAGNDIANMTPEIKAILTNKDVIAIDQDKAGKQGTRLRKEGDADIWVKELADGSRAVALLNRGSTPLPMSVSYDEIGLKGRHVARDLWDHANTGPSATSFSATVAPHSVRMIRVAR